VIEEAEVEIDTRAEMTVAEINLRRIAALETYLQQQRARFEEYRHRLGLIAGEAPKPYSLTEDRVKALPAAEVDPLGLIISDALNNPAKRFKKKD
jgi:outer membrane protein TolC